MATNYSINNNKTVTLIRNYVPNGKFTKRLMNTFVASTTILKYSCKNCFPNNRQIQTRRTQQHKSKFLCAMLTHPQMRVEQMNF